jgi:hypothetical protein
MSFWQLAGPGAILVGLSIGSGELIMWPRIAALYGPDMLWAAGIGVFTQLWVNFELGRYTLATGESVYTGFVRVSRFFVYFFLLINILSWIAPGWAMASGGALKALVVGSNGWGSNAQWTWITFGLVVLLLFGPRLIYNTVEKAISAMVVVITVGLIVTAFTVTSGQTWNDLGRGMINVGYIDSRIPFGEFFSALVFAGAGGTANIFLSYYIRDKNLGMGGRIEGIVNPLRGGHAAPPSTGYIFPTDTTNMVRWRAWLRHVTIDQVFFFFGLNSLTMLLFIIGALAVLRPLGAEGVPSGLDVAVTQSKILSAALGDFGRVLFLLVAFATLFSTQLALIDGMGRTLSDLIYSHFTRARHHSLSWWYGVITGLWIGVGCLLAGTNILPLTFLVNSACMGGIAMAVYCPLTLWINHRYLPREIRPGLLKTLMMVWASGLYIFFAVYYTWTLLR